MKLFFYFLFAIDIAIGIILSLVLNIIVGITTACVLLFINIVTFVVILKIEKKKQEISNQKE
ncbi:MAG: hypothetical protein J6T23_00305 [Elusimicrobia bacterium]|nr:hypothetical protein [Elusimicrobiota bacterium]